MSSLAVAFTDAELDIVLAAARPLAPSDRDRIYAELQRRFVHISISGRAKASIAAESCATLA